MRLTTNEKNRIIRFFPLPGDASQGWFNLQARQPSHPDYDLLPMPGADFASAFIGFIPGEHVCAYRIPDSCIEIDPQRIMLEIFGVEWENPFFWLNIREGRVGYAVLKAPEGTIYGTPDRWSGTTRQQFPGIVQAFVPKERLAGTGPQDLMAHLTHLKRPGSRPHQL